MKITILISELKNYYVYVDDGTIDELARRQFEVGWGKPGIEWEGLAVVLKICYYKL